MNLFSSKQFLPLFITQFLGALNDNLLKNALVILVTYYFATEQNFNAQIIVTLAAGLFILPFFLFSAAAGQLADKYDRSKITRIIKIIEIIIMIGACIGFYMQNLFMLLGIIFLMGAHSAFFGPIKYAILPQHLPDNQLLRANAYIECATFIAILFGTIIGGLLILQPNGSIWVSTLLLIFAIFGCIASFYMPQASPPAPDLKININIWQETLNIISFARKERSVFLSILGISWFWLIGATVISQLPTYAKDILHANETLVTLFLVLFSIGIGSGSILCNRLIKGHIENTYVPIAVIGVSVFLIDLFFASKSTLISANSELIIAWQFIQTKQGLRICIDLLAMAICCGLYTVPLYATMQSSSAVHYRARIIAANNIMNSLFMVGAAIFSLIILKLSFSVIHIFLSIAIVNVIVAIYICQILPNALLRSMVRTLFRLLYRVEVKGLDNYYAAGDRILLIANHTSLLDGALIAACLPDKITFAINTQMSQKWWIKPLLLLVDAFALDPKNPMAIKELIHLVRKNQKCLIFPEGRISTTGSLMKIYEGPGMIADKSDARLLPIRIEGAQYTPFSKLRGKVKIRLFPKITITILPACDFKLPDNLNNKEHRQMVGDKLYDVMAQMMLDTGHYHQTLFSSLLSAKDTHGKVHILAQDAEGAELNYATFITKSLVMGKIIGRVTGAQKTIGLMLPTSIGASLSFFGLQSIGRIVAMINYTAGSSAIISACSSANIKTIITSERFVQLANLGAVIADIKTVGIEIIWMEQLKKTVKISDKLLGLIAKFIPKYIYNHRNNTKDINSPAAILFTSGSEGSPKGVVLSHVNLLANCYQLSSCFDFNSQDKVFNCLPMFHSFGLTGGTLLPIFMGIATFYYPSPLDYKIIPELIYDSRSTIFFATDTFLASYASFAHSYDFHGLRYIFAGAEKLKDKTRQIYMEKFGIRIFEGYGATEAAPIISANTPMHFKSGSVGRFLPGIEYKLVSIQGIEEGGQLWVKGKNIMTGYFRAENPEQLEVPIDGWYDTGDIVSVDNHGYIHIHGRAKRFAKIAGEMISLTMIESALSQLWPTYLSAVVAVDDEKKGEQIILLTINPSANKEEVIAYFKQNKIPELSIPKKIHIVENVPLLGSGKVDYQSVKKIVAQIIDMEKI